MKNIYKILILGTILFSTSCEDYLDRTPLDSVSEVTFYSTPSDLQAGVNGFYNDLPGWSALSIGFNILPDMYSDMGTAQEPSNRLSGLSYEVPTSASGSVWSWDEVREANWLLDHVDQAEGDETLIGQYTGEAYFFRAYYYFELLKKYGDLPIFPEYFDNTDEDYIYAARDSRNEVVDFMISDLDTAISLLQSFPDISGHPRISKEVAQLFKARVALYEGTWERYHRGTDFGVDGSDGTAFLQIAAEAAEDVMNGGVFSLYSDYQTLFNQVGYSGNSEVMLWRDYNSITLNIANVIQQQWPNRCGYTLFAVDSYLCTDGDPISVSTNYMGNKDLSTIEINRDPRLAATIMVPGDLVEIDADGIENYWSYPDFSSTNTGLTGYESEKYRNAQYNADYGDFTEDTSRIIFRYAEALLIFAEAKAELGTITQSDLDRSINLLRDRVGMPHMTLGAITTDLEWPNYGYTLTDILYEVRRERSVELMAEGFRADDLYRWRAHSLFDGDQPRGAYLEDGIVNTTLDAADASLDADGYILPFASTGDYNFDESKAYLQPIPLDELSLNPNISQNPGW
ncbi:RagB/SusD family nutrient uptake outer membrane protein [Maribacter sp. TH_r10]|uniref:RagB/SusD family nutrient uptake outer membrane protein n=1 Tax=Maribacter luteus TaxID=2594478 RepID=A0A6I2MNJ5_9FLAO|nr:MULTISPECIES: RagB/SusD family nutrient uptake outer membrane protein [Maribacter]MDV7139196.1 RagB/SusD family nutrient uptake outer membrane protein [Maribacter sp. TH_r10]MRX65361.1 RagB/SusD family nutrient uptake outer membrane protein [Maribacter luteus]